MSLDKPNLQLILLRVTSLCNLNCSYCYVYKTGYRNSLANQPKFIDVSTVLALAKQLKEIKLFYNDLSICLHGGEPLILGKEKLEFILKTLSNVSPVSLSLQTNATLITNEILDLLYKYNCSIGVSLDGEEFVHNKNRVYKDGRGTFLDSKKGLDLINNHPISEKNFSIIIAVIDPYSDPINTYNYLSTYKPNKIDFLFKDGYHGCLPIDKKNLETIEYGKWLFVLAEYYLTLNDPVPIRKIDSLIEDYMRNKLNKNHTEPFGMIVINPDGSITKNELYDITPMTSNFSYNWNVNNDSLLHLLMTKEYKLYTYDALFKADKCKSCLHANYCNGGIEAHPRWNKINGLKNSSIFCSDYKYFFDNITSTLDQHLKMAV